MRISTIFVFLVMLFGANVGGADRESKVRDDKVKVEAEGYWIYGDFAKGKAEAKKTGRPLVVTLRCLPCEQCVKLDEELIHNDETLRNLLDQFVRVRIVSTNGLDLSTFQFDTDQSFVMFFLNADGTIYGRFGTRSHRTEWQEDVSFKGLGQALAGALELHRDYPRNKKMLAAKRGPKPDYPSPEKFPTLKEKYKATLNYEGDVVASCIHCHQIGDSRRLSYLDRGEMIPDQLLFSYPHPKAVGLILDPDAKATVQRVIDDSPAARSGFRGEDRLISLKGQPLLSIADVQWVLHHSSPEGEKIDAVVEHDGERISLVLELTDGWREKDDIAWRVSSWELRRFVAGGMIVKPVTAEQRQSLKLPADAMALRVEHLGLYPPHNVAHLAGFQKEDVIVAFDGKDDLNRETDLLAYAVRNYRSRKVVEIALIRDGKRQLRKLTFP
ncbi:MAG: Trx7/PDZ domain-containing (seleno)protein [Planctomycetota bacterium]|nr:Trx7/PDZ domain-containing (seleno)protein [Planctomycetota bacterium]MDA1212301.1 Trx7/PDZ domain-containing (seleno)protein [Planctomycetota bacterium]